MANNTTVREYALIGAQSRLEKLEAEIVSIRKTFPQLSKGQGAESKPKVGPKKGYMSAKQRAEVSKRMKRYWAAKRKAAKSAAKNIG